MNFRRWVNMRSTLRRLSSKKNGALWRRTVSRRRRAVLSRPVQLGFISRVPEYAKGLGMSLNAGALVVGLDVYMFGMWAFKLYPALFDLQRISDRTGGYGGGTDVSVYYRHAGAYAVVILTLGFFSSAIYTPPSLRWDRSKRGLA